MKLRLTKAELREYIENGIRNVLNEDKNLIPLIDNVFAMRNAIDEGLVMSYAPLKVYHIIQRRFNPPKYGYKIGFVPRKKNTSFTPQPNTAMTTNEVNGWYDFEIVFHKGTKNCPLETICNIIDSMDKMGWLLANVQQFNGIQPIIYDRFNTDIYDATQDGLCKFVFQANYDPKISKMNLPYYCFHICPCRVYQKIKRQGLTPRAEFRSANHSEKVYLFLNCPKNWTEIANLFRNKRDEPYCLLRIDMSKVGNMDFHYDSNMMSEYPSIWTFEPIPSDAILLLDYEGQDKGYNF